jgi:hypothetical protein
MRWCWRSIVGGSARRGHFGRTTTTTLALVVGAETSPGWQVGASDMAYESYPCKEKSKSESSGPPRGACQNGPIFHCHRQLVSSTDDRVLEDQRSIADLRVPIGVRKTGRFMDSPFRVNATMQSNSNFVGSIDRVE